MTQAIDALAQYWRPIAEADKTVTFEQEFDLGDGKTMTLRNSEHYWVRDAYDKIFEATWTDHRGGYWWDIDGESPADPIEYMPHPLEILSQRNTEAGRAALAQGGDA